MSFLRDNLIPFFKRRELRFIESRPEAEDVRTFVFEKPADLAWHAGQYGLFTVRHKSVKNGTRPFSVSSAPAENIVRFTTRVGKQPSEFKQALLELAPGMTIEMRGPVGPFYLKEEKPALLIAGGMGITPYRSMLMQLGASPKSFGQPIRLLYMDGEQKHLFRDELDEIAGRRLAEILYLDSRDELARQIDEFVSRFKMSGICFAAGPKTMVDEITQYLLSKQVPKQNIRKDVFIGY